MGKKHKAGSVGEVFPGVPSFGVGVAFVLRAVFGMRQGTDLGLSIQTLCSLGFKLKSWGGGAQEGRGLSAALALPERCWWMELLPWEWRQSDQEEVISSCRSDAHPTLPGSGPQSGGEEPHCLCCQETCVIIYTGWARDAQKASVCLQLWFQPGMAVRLCAPGWGWRWLYASGQCGPGSGLALCDGACLCMCLAKDLSGCVCVCARTRAVSLALCVVSVREMEEVCLAVCVYFGFLSLFDLRKLAGGEGREDGVTPAPGG